MAIKETPTNAKVYYKLFVEENKQKLNDALLLKREIEEEIEVKHKNIEDCKNIYLTEFGFNVDGYSEYKDNRYSTGNFLKAAKGLLINKQNNYELITDAFDLYDLANRQKDLHDVEDVIVLYKKCSEIKIKDYTEILRLYYTEVHKKLILEGQGYSISNGIGWICVNRCVFDRKHKMLDYAATKKREKELKEQGKRIYNKEEAEWCVNNGIEYKAEDKRVFVCNEYCYQIPLIDSKLPNGSKLKLEVTDYRHRSIRGKTNEDLIKECNNDTKRICELPIDLKTKLTLCDKVDKILYTKFIRNENQKPITFGKTNR